MTGPSDVHLRLRAMGWLSLWAIAVLLNLVSVGSLRAEDAVAPTAAPATAAPAAKAAPATDKPAASEKKPDGEKKAEKKAEKKPDEGKPAEGQPAAEDKDKPKDIDQPVHRPTEPPKPADAAELKARPDESGMVTFSFRGQPWQAVLEWLADISHMSLDWQEAPAGYLDLTTRRKYTVDEARDLINSILLSKGYTLLRNGEILLVANLKTLDTSLVPRVTLKELDKRGSYELVRVFFPLERLQAEPMAEELKPLLSVPYGKINAMKTTNRLDIMDTAGNLRRIRDVVGAEQGESGKSHQLREFKLHNARADDVMTTLKQLLGIQDKPAGPMNPQEMQQEMQRQQQMMQQMQQQQGDKKNAVGPKDQEPKTYLAINRRENSIMALATPDKLAVIEQAVSLIDVPSDNNTSFANVNRVRIYRLIGAEPGPIVNVLKDMGNLDPSTRLETDVPNKAIIVSGPLVDHATVQALIDKLDGSTRRFEVIQLRKLGADYVAGSIEFLMRGPSKDTGRPRVYYDFGGGGSNRNTDPNKDGGFQVEADTKNNRLLLRVNDVELQEIRALMIKLGEDPVESGRGETMRIIHSTPGKETDLLLERLKRVWPSISNSPLQLDNTPAPAGDSEHSSTSPPEKKNVVPAKSDKIEDSRQSEKSAGDDSKPQAGPLAASDARMHEGRHLKHHSPEVLVAVKELNPAAEQAADSLASNEAAVKEAISDTAPGKSADVRDEGQLPGTNRGGSATPPPISIVRGRQGLIVSSPDPATVEQLTKLIDQLSPNDARFQVFTLKHTYARDVCSLLEKIFEEGDGKEKPRGFNPFFFDFDEPKDDKKDRNRLSKREPLKFTPDSVTNSILVQNAEQDQLDRIRELVEFYDRAEPPDSQSIRKTQIIAVKHAKAQAVADVLKDVYRDLLSPNDKALVSNNPRQEQPRPAYTYFNMGDNKSATDNVPKFKGLLSIGIDATSNSLVVSAPQFLLSDVLSMIDRLDAATLPKEPVVRVINVGGMLDDPYIKDAIKSVADPSAKSSSSSSRRDRDRQNGQGNGQNGNNNNGPNGSGQNNNRNGSNGNGGGNNNR